MSNSMFILQKNILTNKLNFKLLPKKKVEKKINNYKKNYQIFKSFSFFLNQYNYFSFFSFSVFELFKDYNFIAIIKKITRNNIYLFFSLFYLKIINNFSYFIKNKKNISLIKKESLFYFFKKQPNINLYLSFNFHKIFEIFLINSYYKFKSSILDLKILFFTFLNFPFYYNFITNNIIKIQKIFFYKLIKNLAKDNISNISTINNKQYYIYNLLKIYYNFNKKWKIFEKTNKNLVLELYRNKLFIYFLKNYQYTFKIFYKNIYLNLIKKRIYSN